MYRTFPEFFPQTVRTQHDLVTTETICFNIFDVLPRLTLSLPFQKDVICVSANEDVNRQFDVTIEGNYCCNNNFFIKNTWSMLLI